MKKILFLLLLAEFSLQSMSRAQQSLFKAARWGNAIDIDKALRKGANINAVNEDGKTALAIVISDTYCLPNKIEKVKKLVKSGANVNLKMNILKMSMNFCSYKLCDYTALMLALLENNDGNCGSYEIIEILIKEGKADIDAQNIHGNSALMMAAEKCYLYQYYRNYLDTVKLLVENGANIYQKNIYGETAIDIARRHKNKYIVIYLEEVGQKNVKNRLSIIEPLVSQYIPITKSGGPGDIILEYLEEDYVPEVEKKFEEETQEVEKQEVEKRQDKACVIS